MNKYACYCMTRNYYKNVIPSLKSLLIHSDVDRVFLLIEDDNTGFDLPDNVECINISSQEYIAKDGVNYNNPWAWIVLLRVALSKIFPEYDRILSLDCDTLVVGDISGLWDIPIGKNYVAGAIDLPLAINNRSYINAGVVLWNLKQLRDGKDDEMIRSINTIRYKYPEQDCVNALCEGRKYIFNGIYNSGAMSRDIGKPRILHFAGKGIKTYLADPRVQKYAEIPWDECRYRIGSPESNKARVCKSGKFSLCGACDSVLIVPKQKFCHECGKEMQW